VHHQIRGGINHMNKNIEKHITLNKGLVERNS